MIAVAPRSRVAAKRVLFWHVHGSYATALVQVRQATGTIVDAGQTVQRIDPLIFYQLPTVNTPPDSPGATVRQEP